MNWWQTILLGIALGVFVGTPICYGIVRLYRNTLERRAAKVAIHNNQFLVPIDAKDYDAKMWADKITPDTEQVNKLNEKLFKNKDKEEGEKPEVQIQ